VIGAPLDQKLDAENADDAAHDADIESFALEHAALLDVQFEKGGDVGSTRLRDRLIDEGDNAINEALVEFPQLDRQMIRQLIREALKEKKENKPPAASRKLFQALRQLSNT